MAFERTGLCMGEDRSKLRSKIRPYSIMHGCACTNTLCRLSASASRALQWALRSRPDSGATDTMASGETGAVFGRRIVFSSRDRQERIILYYALMRVQ